MAPIKPQNSSKGLAELVRSVYIGRSAKDGSIVHRTLLANVRHWAVVLIVSAWIVMLLAAPLLLVLLLFRINYTVEWLINALWLLGISLVAGGLYIIIEWFEQYFYHEKRTYSLLFAGIGILVVTLSTGFLLWQGTNDAIHPLVAIGASSLFLALSVGWGVYRLITERQTHIIFRLSFLLAMLCLGVGLLISSISLKREFFDIPNATYQRLQTISQALWPISWSLMLISQVGRTGEREPWSKRTLALLIVTIILILVFAALVIWR
jgi:hypothetical protein